MNCLVLLIVLTVFHVSVNLLSQIGNVVVVLCHVQHPDGTREDRERTNDAQADGTEKDQHDVSHLDSPFANT